MPRSVEGLLQILSQRRAQKEQMRQMQREQDWKEGQAWPDFGRKVLGGLLGGGINLGMARLGEEWLPSKIAEQELTALKIAKQKRLAEEAKRKADVRKFEVGSYVPETGMLQEDYAAQEALMKRSATEAGLAEQRDLQRKWRELTPEVERSTGIRRPPQVGRVRPEIVQMPTPEQLEARTPQTMKQYSKEVIAEAKKQMSDEDFAKSQAAAKTAAGLWPMMKREFRGQRPKDKTDFMTYFQEKTRAHNKGEPRLYKFDDLAIRATYDAVRPEANAAARNGIVVDGKTLRGRQAAVYVMKTKGAKIVKGIKDAYSGHTSRAERERERQAAILKRQELAITSREKISANKIKQLNKKLDNKKLQGDARIRVMRERNQWTQQHAAAELELKVHRMTKSRRTVTSDIYGQPVERVEDPVMTPEEAKKFQRNRPAYTPAKGPAPTSSKAPSSGEDAKSYLRRLKGLGVQSGEKLRLLKKHFPNLGKK